MEKRFEEFLQGCGITDEVEKCRSLRCRVKWDVFEHVQSETTYDGLITGLDKLFTTKKNVNASRNKLLSARQKGGRRSKLSF